MLDPDRQYCWQDGECLRLLGEAPAGDRFRVRLYRCSCGYTVGCVWHPEFGWERVPGLSEGVRFAPARDDSRFSVQDADLNDALLQHYDLIREE